VVVAVVVPPEEEIAVVLVVVEEEMVLILVVLVIPHQYHPHKVMMVQHQHLDHSAVLVVAVVLDRQDRQEPEMDLPQVKGAEMVDMELKFQRHLETPILLHQIHQIHNHLKEVVD
tara:strand:+ start:459 stop:803 length:345 start_codon:yes stop_codon:yes gene_type:complete